MCCCCCSSSSTTTSTSRSSGNAYELNGHCRCVLFTYTRQMDNNSNCFGTAQYKLHILTLFTFHLASAPRLCCSSLPACLPDCLPVVNFFFFGSVALNVTEFCSDRLNEIDDVWDVKSLRVFQTLNDITEVVESWIQVCDSLTRLFWPNYARHAWIGGPHIPKTATLYLKRLHAIQAIRNVYKEIVSLFNEINQIDKSVRRIFIPFRGEC